MNPSLIWLGAALFTWGIGEGMFLLFQPLYLQQLGADPIQIGVILGAFGAVMTLAHVPAGHLSDRIGRRPMLIAAWFIGIAATLIMGFATTLNFFIVGIMIYGFTAFVASPLDSYVTAARGKWSVARAITFVSMTFNAGAVIGPITGGWIGDHYGLRTVFFIAAGIFVLSTFLIWSIASQPRDHHDPADPPQNLLTNRRYLGFLSVFFVVAFATYIPQPLTPNFLQNQHGLSLSVIGQLGSIGGIGNTVLNFLLGQLEARSGFMLGQVGVAAFTFILWRGSGFGWFALAYFLLGGFRALRGLGVAQVRPFVHESQMGLAYGITETLGSSTVLLAPPLAGYLYSRDPSLMYPVSLALIGIGLVISLIFIPRSKRLPPDHIELAPDL
ncbi:MAG TPA: MFS transporter [Anaerolineales bacterium]|nr:MFS transporter [Anaerolineales bacterium]